MAVTRRALIAGNWKMNVDHLHAIALTQKVAWTLRDAGHDFDAVEVAVFPPFTDLRSLQSLVAADRLPIALGAQDVSEHDEGAHTGEVAASFLRRLDVRYVIVGHSERRAAFGETDEIVGRKAAAAVRHGLVPVICVGENPVEQLAEALQALTAGAEYVVAYEPLWAIGSGEAASPEHAEHIAAQLREAVGAAHGDQAAAATRILYGGSVSVGNVAGFLAQADVDGALVGGASLKAKDFSDIAQFQKHVVVPR